MESLYPKWKDYKSLHVSVETVERCERSWKTYYSNSEIIKVPLKRLTKIALDSFVHETIKRYNMNKHAYGNFTVIINQMLDYAVELQLVDENLFKKVKVNKRSVLTPEIKKVDGSQIYYKEEVEEFFKLADQDFNNKVYKKHQLAPLAAEFLFVTGLRIGEVCSVRYEDLNGNSLLVQRGTKVREAVSKPRTKGAKGFRTIYLNEMAMNIINRARKHQEESGVSSDGYIFSMTDNPLSYSSLEKIFPKYCRKMETVRKSSHKARKTFISTLLEGGVNVDTIRAEAGQQYLSTMFDNYSFDRHKPEEKNMILEEAIKGLF